MGEPNRQVVMTHTLQPSQPTVVAVFNQKGGIGKTTTTTNLAVCLAAMGYPVGVIDLDTQGNATSSLGVVPAPARGANDLLFGSQPVADLFLPTLFPNLLVCGANDLLTSAEIRLSMSKTPQDVLRKRLVRSPLAVAFVLIDCPPAFGMLPLNALAAAQRAIMPVTAEPLAHDGLQKAWTNMRRITSSLNPALAKPDLLLTMLSGSGSGADLARMIQDEFGRQVFATEIPRDDRVIEAAMADLPVCVHDPMSPAARAYVRMALEFVDREDDRRGGLTLARSSLAPAAARSFEAIHEVLRQWNVKARPDAPETAGWTTEADALAEESPPPRRRRPTARDGVEPPQAAYSPLPEDWVRETS